MNLISPSLPAFFVAILGLALTIGGLLALRQGYNKQVTEMQKRVIDALKEEIASLDRQIIGCKTQVEQLSKTVSTIRYVFKQQGVIIRVTDNMVTITDKRKNRQTTVSLKDDKILDEDLENGEEP
jgi:Fe-S oxidoreductase